MHPAASDSRLQQPKQHITLGKATKLQSNQAGCTGSNTSAALISSTSKGDVSLLVNPTDYLCSSSNQHETDDNSIHLSSREETPEENVNVNILTAGATDETAIAGSIQENSDSGSVISIASTNTSVNISKSEDGDNASLRTKKRRSFFNFRRSKKDKKEIL